MYVENGKRSYVIIFYEGGDFMRIIGLIVSLIPMPFLFHYYETTYFPNRVPLLFLGILVFVIMAGLLSTKIKYYYIILINIFTICGSVALGTQFIIPPNDSWFNPFGMNTAIIITGIVILVGVLIIRFVSKIVLSKLKNE